MILKITFIALILKLDAIQASLGDDSIIFNECMQKCWFNNCTALSAYDESGVQVRPREIPFENNQPYYLKLLGWDCSSECQYACMWHTVNVFEKVYNHVPQFYGKWPFVRVLGIQEPVSALASILNLLANLHMIKKMNRRMSPKSSFRFLWNAFGWVCINTWVWSTIFHTRDIPFTEKMDYFSAFGFVLFQFNCFFVRVFKFDRSPSKQFLMYFTNFFSLLYFVYHCYYLGKVEFDYGYNMSVNIAFGALNSVCWIFWSFYNYYSLNRKYVWRCAFSVILFDVLMALEIFDFSPLFWHVDSHALWHLSTVAIPFFWYRFLIDDDYFNELKGNHDNYKHIE